jgi:mannose-6-phosphate isomerase-like protein (cupin superfamily)
MLICMPIIEPPKTPTHEMEAIRFWQLAAPSRGSSEASVWRVEVSPDADAVPHELTREEILVVIEGTARATLDGLVEHVDAGGAIVVPPHTSFSLAAVGPQPLVALAYLPVGGQAKLEGGEPFVPPWAQ